MVILPLIFTKHQIFDAGDRFAKMQIIDWTFSWRHFSKFLSFFCKSTQKARKMNSQFRTRALSKYGNCKIIKPAFMGLKLVRNNFKIHQRVKWLFHRPKYTWKKMTGLFARPGSKTSGMSWLNRSGLRGSEVFQRIEVTWTDTNIVFWNIFKSDPN